MDVIGYIFSFNLIVLFRLGIGTWVMKTEAYKQHYKAEARQKLVNEGYNIWGIIGDRWSSFDGNPKAKRTFEFPNSLYYVS